MTTFCKTVSCARMANSPIGSRLLITQNGLGSLISLPEMIRVIMLAPQATVHRGTQSLIFNLEFLPL